MATGVLVVAVGSGTKQLHQFLGGMKEYETTCVFGTVTDSYDAVGKILRREPVEHITREIVEKALDSFKGDILQQPPMYVPFNDLRALLTTVSQRCESMGNGLMSMLEQEKNCLKNSLNAP